MNIEGAGVMSDWLRFKTEINLTQYAAFMGYEIVKKGTTRASIKMRRGDDIVIISKRGNKWIYFAVSGDNDNGTIVNFIQNRTGQILAEIAKDLLAWLGEEFSRPEPKHYSPEVIEQKYDPQRVRAIFKGCAHVKTHQYLACRGITSASLSSTRFTGRIYTDRYHNAVFPHYNDNGVCGLELKNSEMAIFVRGSEKTFWRSNCKNGDNTLIIGEAVIDALSHSILFPDENAIYAASGGGMSPDQRNLLKDLVTSCHHLKNIVIITDNDNGGDCLHDVILSVLNDCVYQGDIKRHSPDIKGQDWNDVLKGKILFP